MINQDEIKAKAIEFDIHHPNVERDYVFGWLLKSFFENDFLRTRLVFKGGNCLRKAYYRNTRFSGDLDFSVDTAIDAEVMRDQINNACREAQAACGVEFLLDRNTFVPGPMIDKDRRSYKGRVYFTDFFGNQNDLTISVKLDVTDFDRLHLPATKRKLIHPYSDAATCSTELTCMALEEVVASKLKCLIQRRNSHDLFDLVYSSFFDRSVELDCSLVLRTFLKKTIFSASPGAAKGILLDLPMTFFSGVWEKYILCPKATRFNFDRAVEGFKGSLERLFDGVKTGGWGEQLYFRGQHRHMIMEAGAERKLLKLTYHGIERLVEPYSLTFKQAAGKQAREYFYAYDTTGGRSRGPSIKTFVNTDVENLSLTDEKFVPRHEIELSKAGEQPRNSYFGKGFSERGSDRPARPMKLRFGRTTKGSVFGGYGSTYKVQCPYCQKIFVRKTHSLDLNAHKSPDGYQCGGRRGHRIY